MVFVITVGTKVQGKLGHFLPIETNAGQRKARQMRGEIFGTVLKSLPAEQWRIYWTSVGKSDNHKKTILKFVAD